MKEKNTFSLFRDKKIIVLLVGLLTLISLVALWIVLSQRSKVSTCSIKTCPTGCCINNKCLPKSYKNSGFTCMGKGNWLNPQGEFVAKLPKSIIQSIQSDISQTTALQLDGSVTSPNIEELTNLEIAKKTIEWVDGQKSDQKIHYFSEVIDGSGNKKEQVTDNRVGVYPIWAKYIYWKNTKDSEVFDWLKTDLAVMTDANIIPIFQPGFWSCKLLYDIWSDQSIAKDVKDNAQKLCYRKAIAVSELNSETSLKPNTLVNEIPEADLDYLLKIDSSASLMTPDQEVETKDRLVQLSAFSSDFSSMYKWDGNENNIVIAKSLFNLASSYYEKLRLNNIRRSSCVFAIASLDLAKVTNDSKYQIFAKNIFQENLNNSFSKMDLFEKSTCMTLSDELSSLEPNPEYKNYSEYLLKDIKETHFDIDSGCFFELIGSEIIKDVKDNSLLSTSFVKSN